MSNVNPGWKAYQPTGCLIDGNFQVLSNNCSALFCCSEQSPGFSFARIDSQFPVKPGGGVSCSF